METNTEAWLEWRFEHNHIEKKDNIQTVDFLLGEIQDLTPVINDNGGRYYPYWYVKIIVEEARKITNNIINHTCGTCSAQLEDVRPGKTQCPNCG